MNIDELSELVLEQGRKIKALEKFKNTHRHDGEDMYTLWQFCNEFKTNKEMLTDLLVTDNIITPMGCDECDGYSVCDNTIGLEEGKHGDHCWVKFPVSLLLKYREIIMKR